MTSLRRMRINVNIICSALLMINLSFIIIKEYAIIQCYHYELSKYFYHIKERRKSYYYFLYFLLGLFVIRFDLLYLIFSLILSLYLVRNYDVKYTNRVKRVLFINFVLLIILFITNTLKYVFIVPFLYLLLVHFLSLQIEKIVYLKFLKKAKSKIKDKKIIGITGSCGKTSVKNIIYDLMVNDFNVNKTPKSYNNKVGIVKSINENVSKYDDYFICEYGVDRVKGMDSLLKIVTPDVAIITEINNQHLLSFKSVENIFKEKIKLIESLKVDGIGIINNDNECLRKYNYKNRTILTYGIKNKSDVMAKNIKLYSDHSEFDLYIKEKFISKITLTLISMHSIENVLCAISACLAIDMDIECIIKNIKNITNIPNRLESKLIDGIEVIDDGFNSNIKGFLEALEVLKLSNKYKILITPGIIEQGDNNKKISYIVASKIIETSDFVFLVTDNSKYIEEYFKNNNFKNYIVKECFIDAFNEAKMINKEKIILIENDLPNIYLK